MVDATPNTPSRTRIAENSQPSGAVSQRQGVFSTGDPTGDLIRGITTYVLMFTGLLLVATVVLTFLEVTLERRGWTTAEYTRRVVQLAVVLAVAFFFIRLVRSSRITDRTRLVLGAIAFVMFIFIGAFYGVRNLDVEGARMLPTWVSLMVVTFPLLVPGSNRFHIMMALIAAVSIPVGVPIYAATAGYPEATSYQIFLATFASSLGVWITCAIAVTVAYRSNRLREKLISASTNLDVAEEKLDSFGSYTLETMLGKGGMGEVWVGRHTFLKRPAAVKLIRKEVVQEHASSIQPSTSIDEILTRFEREANATALLTSQNTVQVYDFGRTDSGTFYFVMELLRGMTFDRFVRKYGPVPQERVVYWLKQVCASLAEAHERGLVHRDIKPQNLFVCQAGMRFDVVKVLDFGLVLDFAANQSGDAPLTAPNAVAGTPSYMAPEQARSRKVDHRADIYALGCVAYFLLTGTSVFHASTPIDRIIAHIQETPEPLDKRRPDLEIDPQLNRVVLRCLSKEPDRRFPSAIDVARELESLSLPKRWNQEIALSWARKHPECYMEKERDKAPRQSPARVRPAHAVFTRNNPKPPANGQQATKIQTL